MRDLLELVRLPGIAPGLPPWREGILLLNHNREIERAGSVLALPAMLFQQRTNTSCYLAIPTRGFTAALSVFRGTPPAKPLDCKILFARSGGAIDRSWAYHAGDVSKHALPDFRLSPEDII